MYNRDLVTSGLINRSNTKVQATVDDDLDKLFLNKNDDDVTTTDKKNDRDELTWKIGQEYRAMTNANNTRNNAMWSYLTLPTVGILHLEFQISRQNTRSKILISIWREI